MSHESSNAGGVLMVGSAAVIWGSTGVAISFALLEGTGSLAAAAVMTAIGALAMVAFTGLSCLRKFKVSLIVYGLFAIAAFRLLYAYSVWVNGAGVTSSLLYTAPLLVAVFSPLLINERPDAVDVVLAAVAVAGAYVASNPSLSVSSVWGFIVGLSLGGVYALTIIAIKRFYAAGYSRDELMVQSTLAAVPILFAVAFIAKDPFPSSVKGFIALLWAGVVCLAIGLRIYLEGMKYVSALHASVVTTLEPVSSVFLAHALLGEAFTLLQIAGIVAIVTSSVVVAFRNARKEQLRIIH